MIDYDINFHLQYKNNRDESAYLCRLIRSVASDCRDIIEAFGSKKTAVCEDKRVRFGRTDMNC
jgi:hypothetical protein